jgi:alpha-1,2-mannosyltransferase
VPKQTETSQKSHDLEFHRVMTQDKARRLFGYPALVSLTLLLSGLLAHLALWQISEPAFLFSDFFKAYYVAGEAVLADEVDTLYREGAEVTFVNMPILAYVFAPLARLDDVAAGRIFLALGLAAAFAAWALLVRIGRNRASSAALLAFIFLINGPMVNSLREGNSTHFLLLLLVLALLLWRAGWDYSAGLVLGFCALFKLPLLLLGAYVLLRRRWRIVAGGATMAAVVIGLSLWLFGFEIHVAWYRVCVAPYMRGVVPAFNVQSIDAFLLRLSTGAALLQEWLPMPLPPAWRLVRTLLLLAIYAVAVSLIWRTGRREPFPRTSGALSPRDLTEFSLVLTIALISSPLAWTHYYLLLLLPWSLYQSGLLNLPDDTLSRSLMWSALAFISLPVLMPELPQGFSAEIMARTVVSMWLFGGLLMLIALARGAWSLGEALPYSADGTRMTQAG